MFLLLQCPCCYKLLVSIVLSPGNLPPSFQPPKASPSHHLPSCPPRAFSFLLKHPILQSFPFCLQDSSDTFPKTKAQLLSKNKNIWRKAPCSWEQPASRTRLKAGRDGHWGPAQDGHWGSTCCLSLHGPGLGTKEVEGSGTQPEPNLHHYL